MTFCARGKRRGCTCTRLADCNRPEYTDRRRKCRFLGSTLGSVGDSEAGGRQVPNGDLSDRVDAGLRGARSKSVDELVDAVRRSGYAHLDASVGQVPYRPPQAQRGSRAARPPAKSDALDPADEDKGAATLGSGWVDGAALCQAALRVDPVSW